MKKQILATVNRLFCPKAFIRLGGVEQESRRLLTVNRTLYDVGHDKQGSESLKECVSSASRYGYRQADKTMSLSVTGSYSQIPFFEWGLEGGRLQNVIMCKTEDSDELCHRLITDTNLGPLWSVPMSVLFHLDLVVNRVGTDIVANKIVIQDTGSITRDAAYASYFTRNLVLPDTSKDVSHRCNGQTVIFAEPPKWLPMALLTKVPGHGSIKLYNSADEVVEDIATVLSSSCTRMESLFNLGCIACPMAENCAKYLCGIQELSPAISADRLTRALSKVSMVITPTAANSVRGRNRNLDKLPKYMYPSKSRVADVDIAHPTVGSVFSSIINADEDILNSRMETVKAQQLCVKKLSDLMHKCQGCALKRICYDSLDPKRSGVERRSSHERTLLLEEVCVGPVTDIDKLRDSLDAKVLLRNALIATMSKPEDPLDNVTTTCGLTVSSVDKLVNELLSSKVRNLLPLYKKYVGNQTKVENRRIYGFLPRSAAHIMAGYNKDGVSVPLIKSNSGRYGLYEDVNPHDLYSKSIVLSLSSGHRLFTSIAGDSNLYAVYTTWNQAPIVAAPVHAIGVLDREPMRVSHTDMLDSFIATVATLAIGAAKYRFGNFGSSVQAVPLSNVYQGSSVSRILSGDNCALGRPASGTLDILLAVAMHSDYSCIGIRVMRAIKETLNASKAEHDTL